MGEQTTVLLANRSKGALLFEQAMMQREGRVVRLATRGTDAWRLARELRPRLVMFGWDLGDLLAPELCRLLRSHEATKRISLMLVCDPNEQAAADLCLAAGCNEIIHRPLHLRELEWKVDKLLSIPPRRPIRTLTRVELDGRPGTLLAETVNLSTTGMLLQIDRTLPPAVHLMLQFFLENGSSPIRARSEVVRAEFTGGTPRYGVRFLEIPNEQRSMIDSFVRRIPEGHA